MKAKTHQPQDDDLARLREELTRLRELEKRVRARCKDAVPQWAPELRELLSDA